MGRGLPILLFSLLVTAWGLNYLFVRAGLHDAAPLWLAFLRSSLGALGAAAILFTVASRGHLDRRGKRDALLLGLPNTALFFGLWFVAAGSVLPGLTSVIVYTFPLWVAILSGPVLRHRLARWDWLAVAGGFFGVVLIARPWGPFTAPVPPVAVLELLGGAMSWAAGTVYLARRFHGAELVEANTYQLAGGAIGLLVAALILERDHIPSPSLPLLEVTLWLGLVGTAFAYTVWFWMLSRTRAAPLSAYVFLVPVVALVASAILFHERLDALQIVGVVFVLLALYGLGVRRGKSVVPDTLPPPSRGPPLGGRL